MFHQVDGFVVGVTAAQDMWSGGGIYPFQSTVQSLEIVSASADDAAAGAGARTALVTGLDTDYQAVTELVVLNGLTPVALATQMLRVNDVHVLTAGSAGQNAGNVTVRLAGGGASQAIVLAGRNHLQQLVYTVPAGRIYEITDIAFSVVTSQAAGNTWAVFGRRFRAAGELFFNGLEVSISDLNTTIINLGTPIFLPPRTDLKYSAQANSASTLAVSIRGRLHDIPENA